MNPGPLGTGARNNRLPYVAAILLAGLLPNLKVLKEAYFLGEDFVHLGLHKYIPVSSSFMLFPHPTIPRLFEGLYWGVGYNLFGLNPHWYLLTNIILNCICAVLVYCIAGQMCDDGLIGLVAGLLFAVNPVHTELVSWISANNTLLCDVFFLAGTLTFLLYLKKRQRAYYLATFFFVITAFLSKEEAITMPFVLVAVDILFGEKAGPLRKVKRHIPFMGLLTGYLLLRFFLFGQFLGGSSIDPATNLYIFFVKIPYFLLFPLNEKIFTGYKIWFASFVLVYLTLAVLFLLSGPGRYARAMAFSVIFMSLTSIPFLGVFFRAEHLEDTRYVYLLSAGFAVLAAVVLTAVLRKFVMRKEVYYGVITAIVLVNAFFLYENNNAWVEAYRSTKAVYSSLQELARQSRGKGVVIYFVSPPRNNPKGARFLGYSMRGLSIFLSMSGKAVGVYEAGMKDGGLSTPGKLDMSESKAFLDRWKPGGLDLELMPLAYEALDISEGRIDPLKTGLDWAVVKWEEDKKDLVVLNKSW